MGSFREGSGLRGERGRERREVENGGRERG